MKVDEISKDFRLFIDKFLADAPEDEVFSAAEVYDKCVDAGVGTNYDKVRHYLKRTFDRVDVRGVHYYGKAEALKRARQELEKRSEDK